MDKMKIGITVTVWGIMILVDLMHGFYGVWSLIGYAVFGGFLWILLSVDESKRKVVVVWDRPNLEPQYWIVYHGTELILTAIQIIKEGIKPGYRDIYGKGVYLTFHFDEAKLYSQLGGAILRLYIQKDVKCIEWEDIPGGHPFSKQSWCNQNGYDLVFIREHSWFVVLGQKGVPVSIPGLAGVEVLDFHGNPINIQ